MVDVSGTNTFGYDSVGELTSVDGPWADDTVTYTYANRLRDSLKIGQPDGDTWVQSYGYDDARRLTNITTSAGSYGYQYDSSRKMMVGRLTFPNSAYVTNNYDSMARLLSTVLETSGNSILDSESYAYNLGSQRTNETFTAGNYLSLGYDNIGQLTSATGLEAGGGTNRLQEQFQYAYDAAHNLNIRTNNGLVQTFNTDPVNRLTNVTRNTGHIFTVAGTTTSQASSVNVSKDSGSPVGTALYGDFTFASTNLFVLTDGTNTFTAVASDAYGRSDTNAVTVNLPVTNSFTYDLNGNLLGDGTRAFDYDDENRLIHITVTNAWRSEFTYDGLMRRRVRMEFTWQYGGWVKTNEVRYVYDGNVVVQERDTNNLPTVTYTRGKDLGGGLQYAGGIGGLLARRDRTTGQTAFYHSDGNGNVKALINAAQAIVAKYSYDPFGNLQSSSGPLADVNLYRFSSKEHHEASDLTYYGRRFYNANLQRWMNQDPIAEAGDINLYRPMENQPTGQIDGLGLDNPIPQLGWIGGSIENYPQQLWVTGTYQSAGPITVTNVGGDPYMQMLLGGIAVGGLAATAIAVSPPLLMAYQIKSNIDELNNENNDTLTRVGNGLQLFGNIILAVVPLAGCVKTALSVRSAASIAAEGGTTALQPMADAAFQTGTIRNVAGYELGGNAGLAGNTYNVNLWGLYATENAQGPFALVNALKGEASAAGASQISITGNAVVNQGLLNIGPGVASRLGFQFQQINPTTILLQGAVH